MPDRRGDGCPGSVPLNPVLIPVSGGADRIGLHRFVAFVSLECLLPYS